MGWFLRLPCVLAGVGALVASAPASGITILDDFDTGPIAMSSPTFSVVTLDTQLGLDPAHVFSGNRTIEVRGGMLEIASTNPGSLFFGSVPDDFGLVEVLYAPPEPVDLLAGGNKSIEFELAQAAGAIQWSLTITDADALVGAVLRTSLHVPLERILLAEFTAQGIDLSRVVAIDFTIAGSDLEIAIDELRTSPIPEPSTALLLGLGLLGLGIAGRTSSRGAAASLVGPFGREPPS